MISSSFFCVNLDRSCTALLSLLRNNRSGFNFVSSFITLFDLVCLFALNRSEKKSSFARPNQTDKASSNVVGFNMLHSFSHHVRTNALQREGKIEHLSSYTHVVHTTQLQNRSLHIVEQERLWNVSKWKMHVQSVQNYFFLLSNMQICVLLVAVVFVLA